MTKADITVAIPVGPNPGNRRYLQECLESVRDQTLKPSEVLVIDDQADLSTSDLISDMGGVWMHVWPAPWRVGIPTAFNFGVSLASNDLIIMLGSDDRLKPWCIEDAWKSWGKHKDALGYYYFDVEYSDGGSQSLACNAAMVHKEMWKRSGGFAPEMSVGACDTMLISILLKHPDAGHLIKVESKEPPYWYRRHDETDTASRRQWYSIISQVRDRLTEDWKR